MKGCFPGPTLQIVLVLNVIHQLDLGNASPHRLVYAGRRHRLVAHLQAVYGAADHMHHGHPLLAKRDDPVALHQFAVPQPQVVAHDPGVVRHDEGIGAVRIAPDLNTRLLSSTLSVTVDETRREVDQVLHRAVDRHPLIHLGDRTPGDEAHGAIRQADGSIYLVHDDVVDRHVRVLGATVGIGLVDVAGIIALVHDSVGESQVVDALEHS